MLIMGVCICMCFQFQGLVVAAFSDLLRPPEKLSEKQSGALMATGLIWSRYSLVIKPKNWNLFSVNMFVAISNGIQLFRIYQCVRSPTASCEHLLHLASCKPKYTIALWVWDCFCHHAYTHHFHRKHISSIVMKVIRHAELIKFDPSLDDQAHHENI